MIQRSCTSANAGSWYKWSKKVVQQDPPKNPASRYKWSKRILIQRSHKVGRGWKGSAWYRDLAQVVLQDHDTSGPEGSWYRDPHTEIFHKWFYSFLIQVVQKSCPTRSCKGSCIRYKWSIRILIQRLCTSDVTGSWCKWSEGILIQIWILMHIYLAEVVLHDPGSWYERSRRSWYRDVAQVVLQHPDTSGRTGAWYRDLAQVVLQDDTSGPKES